MVGTAKWTIEQIVLTFQLRAKDWGKQKIAEAINERWPRRGASMPGVNYVLNTKKKEYEEFMLKNKNAITGRSPTPSTARASNIKSRARADDALQALAVTQVMEFERYLLSLSTMSQPSSMTLPSTPLSTPLASISAPAALLSAPVPILSPIPVSAPARALAPASPSAPVSVPDPAQDMVPAEDFPVVEEVPAAEPTFDEKYGDTRPFERMYSSMIWGEEDTIPLLKFN
ncbi:hypothetical protein BDZ45DRAFT_741697 [Acephala macrosclerotiorum]|nr:hypothetical protein BDZ45DRAFT_741697 [Acephala macrosclerotiorum]